VQRTPSCALALALALALTRGVAVRCAGTGAVKVTPAHDANDYKCGTDHKLQFINILNDDGTLNKECGRFAGLKRFEARELLVAELTKLGLFHGKDKNPMTLSICSRSGDVIEPVIRPQWWVKCKSMADRALKVVETGALEIIPVRTHATRSAASAGARRGRVSGSLCVCCALCAALCTALVQCDVEQMAE